VSTPRVSVVIPVRNGMPHLPQAVESALADLPDDGELVIRNNQSTDGTREWLESLVDPRIRLLESDADDPSWTNFTHACLAAEGRWVKFLCADDYLLPGGLTRLLDAAEQSDAVLVASKRRIVSPSGRTVLKAHGLNGLIGRFEGREAVNKSVASGTNTIGESNLMRRDALRASLPFSGEFPYVMDLDLYARILTQGTFLGISSVDCAYRLSTNSMAVRTGRDQLRQFSSWVTRAQATGLVHLSRWQAAKARITIPLKFGARLTLGVGFGLTGIDPRDTRLGQLVLRAIPSRNSDSRARRDQELSSS
jgi:glycosyltransferase involved in cell wall biosynthesis